MSDLSSPRNLSVRSKLIPPDALYQRPLHLYIISGVKVYHGPFKYRPACTIPSLSHRLLLGLSAPSTSKARGATPLSAAHTLALLLGLPRPLHSTACFSRVPACSELFVRGWHPAQTDKDAERRFIPHHKYSTTRSYRRLINALYTIAAVAARRSASRNRQGVDAI